MAVHNGVAMVTCEVDSGCEPRRSSDVTLQPPVLSVHISPAISPSLRRKRLMWQSAMRHVIDRHDLYPPTSDLERGGGGGGTRLVLTDAYINDINRWVWQPCIAQLEAVNLNYKLHVFTTVKVFRPLDFFHILLHYSLILKLIKLVWNHWC